MRRSIITLLATSLVVALPVGALDAQTAVVVGGPSTAMLRAGTSVPMRTLTELTTNGKLLKVGQRFDLETSEPVSLDGQVVIPTGSHGVGEVTSVRNKGMWGKSGTIEARVLYIRAGDRQIRVSGTLTDKGSTGTAGVVGSVALLPLAGFFVTGTSAVIKSGAPVTAFLDEDVPVTFAAGAPAAAALLVPVAVPAPAAAPVRTVQPAVVSTVAIGAKPK